MNLDIKNQTFLVGGATSGFGLASLNHLIAEDARVIGIARNEEKLNDLKAKYPDNFIPLAGDITQLETIHAAATLARQYDISGVLINAGGPPAMKFEESTLAEWDASYANILRWKVALTQQLLPHFKERGQGKFVFIESASVKQPIENLVLSTSFRLAVVGMVKTLSQETAGQGLTFNILAPGSHDTPAIDRVIQKKGQQANVTFEQAKVNFVASLPSQKLGSADYFGSLAAWLLSPLSEFVNGQVFAVEGGTVKSTL